jgi:hypothetical protein
VPTQHDYSTIIILLKYKRICGLIRTTKVARCKNGQIDAFATQLEKETIKIPGEEKEQIIHAFCGYTTWQDIKNVLPAVDFKTKAEIR